MSEQTESLEEIVKKVASENFGYSKSEMAYKIAKAINAHKNEEHLKGDLETIIKGQSK